MSKFNNLLSRVVIISTYAIIFCIIGNMVIPALIVESVHAQAVSNSTTAQAQADAAKKTLDKAQADAKAASYKELGLTKSEIAFSEDKNFDLNTIFQKVDKFVTYDKNGLASLNANSYRKDGTIKLSKSNTEIVISIVNKMVSKYNLELKNDFSNKVTTNTNPTIVAASNVNGAKISKSLNGRGYDVKISLPSNVASMNSISASSASGNSLWWPANILINYFNASNTWYGWGVTISLTDFGVQQLVYAGGLLATLLGGVSFLCGLTVVGLPTCSLITGALGILAGVGSGGVAWINSWCSGKGSAFKYKVINAWWMPKSVQLGYQQCN